MHGKGKQDHVNTRIRIRADTHLLNAQLPLALQVAYNSC